MRTDLAFEAAVIGGILSGCLVASPFGLLFHAEYYARHPDRRIKRQVIRAAKEGDAILRRAHRDMERIARADAHSILAIHRASHPDRGRAVAQPAGRPRAAGRSNGSRATTASWSASTAVARKQQ